MTVSIVITTKNRKGELSSCLDSCVKLKEVYEILVFDDGSTDGTFEFVKSKYPAISLYRNEVSLGLINARTKCASLAKGDVIVSIDDDCIIQGDDTVSEITAYFSLPKIAAVTIPCIDVLIAPNKIIQNGIGGLNDIYICSQYIGCAHAIRKEVFLKLNGYYDNLVRQEEETEFAMRLYNTGYVIRIANCSHPILHYHSASRNNSVISFYRSRNQFIVNYRLVPFVFMPFVIIKQSLNTIKFEISNKQLKSCLKGYRDAIDNIMKGKVRRMPMSLNNYIFFKKLRIKKYENIRLDEI